MNRDVWLGIVLAFALSTIGVYALGILTGFLIAKRRRPKAAPVARPAIYTSADWMRISRCATEDAKTMLLHKPADETQVVRYDSTGRWR